jgi:hypothetical protein
MALNHGHTTKQSQNPSQCAWTQETNSKGMTPEPKVQCCPVGFWIHQTRYHLLPFYSPFLFECLFYAHIMEVLNTFHLTSALGRIIPGVSLTSDQMMI